MAITTSKTAALDSPLYAGRRRRNAIAKGLAWAATAFGATRPPGACQFIMHIMNYTNVLNN